MMTLSEVLYESACRMSRHPSKHGTYSCEMVGEVGGNGCWDEYSDLMAHRYSGLVSEEVYEAALSVNWGKRDFRTFMLLMASEAVK